MILEEQFLLSIYKFYTLGSPWLLWLTGRYTVWPFICRWCPAGNQDQKKMNHQLMDVFDQLMLRKRAIIETIYDQLKNISPIAQTRHRRGINFLVNIVSALITIILSRRKNFRWECGENRRRWMLWGQWVWIRLHDMVGNVWEWCAGWYGSARVNLRLRTR